MHGRRRRGRTDQSNNVVSGSRPRGSRDSRRGYRACSSCGRTSAPTGESCSGRHRADPVPHRWAGPADHRQVTCRSSPRRTSRRPIPRRCRACRKARSHWGESCPRGRETRWGRLSEFPALARARRCRASSDRSPVPRWPVRLGRRSWHRGSTCWGVPPRGLGVHQRRSKPLTLCG